MPYPRRKEIISPFADQDDIWYEEKFAAQMEAIGDNDLCVSAYHTGTVYRSDRNIKVTHPSCQLEYLLIL